MMPTWLLIVVAIAVIAIALWLNKKGIIQIPEERP